MDSLPTEYLQPSILSQDQIVYSDIIVHYILFVMADIQYMNIFQIVGK